MAKVRVSVGVPVRNGARFLGPALDSLLAQTYADYELIICDNASTDDTEAISRSYAARDKRIQYHRNTRDLGLAGNYNRLFRLSRGEYFRWAAADDVSHPHCLSECVRLLDADRSVVLAYPKTQFIDEAGHLLAIHDPGWDLRQDAPGERLRYVVCAGHWVNATFGLIRAKALSRTRLLPAYPGADYTLLGDLSLLGKFVETPDCLLSRRLHPAASSQNTGDQAWLLRLWTGGGRRACLPAWSRSVDHFVTIVRSGLSVTQRISLTASLLRAMHGRKQRLLGEVRVVSRVDLDRYLS